MEKNLLQLWLACTGNSLRARWPGIRIPVRARFTHISPDRPWGPPASCKMGTGSLPLLEREGRGVDHPSSSSAGVKERVELYLYFPAGPSWPVLGRTFQLLLVFTTKWSDSRGNLTKFWRHPHRIWAVAPNILTRGLRYLPHLLPHVWIRHSSS
jgi:hypothetical protein